VNKQAAFCNNGAVFNLPGHKSPGWIVRVTLPV
jgi:hypothetical protein